jgi:hypothetical protein
LEAWKDCRMSESTPQYDGTPEPPNAAAMGGEAAPEAAGRCAFMGGYVDDGETVEWDGKTYLCQAPNLVQIG